MWPAREGAYRIMHLEGHVMDKQQSVTTYKKSYRKRKGWGGGGGSHPGGRKNQKTSGKVYQRSGKKLDQLSSRHQFTNSGGHNTSDWDLGKTGIAPQPGRGVGMQSKVREKKKTIIFGKWCKTRMGSREGGRRSFPRTSRHQGDRKMVVAPEPA